MHRRVLKGDLVFQGDCQKGTVERKTSTERAASVAFVTAEDIESNKFCPLPMRMIEWCLVAGIQLQMS